MSNMIHTPLILIQYKGDKQKEMDASEEIESIIYTYSDFILMLIHNLSEHWR